MKRKKFTLFFLALLLSSVNPVLAAIDPDTGIYYLKTGDGHEDVTVNETLVFKCTPNATIPTCRDAGVCFSPQNTGEVIQITIDEIDLDDTDNYLLLYNGYFETKYPMPAGWFEKIGADAQENTYISGSADGKFTIGFHSKCSSSTQKGFTITVRSIVPPDMAYKSTHVFLNSASISRGAPNQIILGVNVVTEGANSPLTLTELAFNTSEIPDNALENIKLYASSVFDASTLLGETTTIEANTVFPVNKTLGSGNNYFYVTADIERNATVGMEIPISLNTVKINGESQTITTSSPDNPVVVSSDILIQNQSLTYTVSEPVHFYDDGGPSSNYSPDIDGTITFLPAQTGEVVKITFDDFQTNNSHYFYVYDGQEMDEDRLRGKFSGTTASSIPAPLFSKSEDGALTIRFVSTSSGNVYRGWSANVSSYVTQDLFIESVTTSQYSDKEILRGSENVAVQKVAVTVGGDYGNLSFNHFRFTMNGTTDTDDITAAKLFYTAKSSGFIDDKPFGNPAAASLCIFTDERNISVKDPGTYYFWLAYTIADNATNGNTVSAALESFEGNSELFDEITVQTPVQRNIKSGFQGIHTIGPSANADYPDFASAIAAMQGGVDGAVRFEIEPGTYSENVHLTGIDGTSSNHNIVFTSQSGINNDVIITGGNVRSDYGVITIENTNHVTFENMTIEPANQNHPYAVHIRYVSRYFTLRNTVLKADLITANTYSGMNMVYMQPANIDGNNNDYITLENNTITGGYIGLYLGGTSYIALTKERGAVIRNNTLINQASKGIYIFDEENTLIENNTVISEISGKTNYNGIDVFRNKANLIIRNNRISISHLYYSIGIYLRNETSGSSIEQPALVYNNVVNISNSPNASTYGINVVGDCYNIASYYNTINIKGTGGYAFGITDSYETIRNLVFKNNLLQNHTTSPVYFFSKESQYKAINFSNNAYYTASDLLTNAWGNDLETWSANSGDNNSIIEQATFLSGSDLHLMEAGNLQSAEPVSFIPADADNKLRHGITPTIGAYEYGDIVITVPEMEESYPKTGTITYKSIEYTTKWNQSGTLYALIRLDDNSNPPSKEDLLQSDPVDVNGGIEKSILFTGLEEETSYIAYFLLESALGIQSEIVVANPVNTHKQIFPLVVTLPEEWGRINAGESTTLEVEVTGGVEPYYYEWINARQELLSEEETLTIEPDVTSAYTLYVKDAQNTEVSARTVVLVNGEAQIATFDDLHLESESYWQGYEDKEESVFYSGSYSFTNTYIPEWMFWGGFAYSNVTATDFEESQYATHQFRSVTGQGVDGSDNYAIVYSLGIQTEIKPTHNTSGDSIAGVYLTNNAWTYHSMTEGDTYAGDPFEQDDYYKVIFEGIHADNTSSTIECYLADYRSEDPDDHYILTDWKWFDLSPLGKLTKISVSVDGSRKGNFGLNTPGYFCMDNLGAKKPATPPAFYTVSLSATQGGLVTGEGEYEENTLVTVIATADTKYEFVNWTEQDEVVSEEAEYKFIITSDRNLVANFFDRSGWNRIDAKIDVYVKNDRLFINTSYPHYIFNIYFVSGHLLFNQEAKKNTEININHWAKGVYIVEIIIDKGKKIERIIKQ
jgi:parallel beta-helix repeat protein